MKVLLACLPMVFFAAACAPAAAPRVQAPTHVTVSAVEAPAPEGLLARRAPRSSFPDVSGPMRTDCAQPDAETTFDMLQAVNAETFCVESAMIRELERASRMTPAVADIHAGHPDFVEDVCWMTEEIVWMDFDSGVRDDGTIRTFAEIECKTKARLEQAYLLRTIGDGDPAAFARHVEDTQAAGGAEKTALDEVRTKARALVLAPFVAAQPGEPERPNPLARVRYLETIETIAEKTQTRANKTCRNFPGLADEFGGANACERKVAAYFVALGHYSRDLEGESGCGS